MTKRWISKYTDEAKSATLAESLKVDLSVARLLILRGIENFEEARHFFRPDLSHLNDPFLMKDMDAAVNRLSLAFEKHEKILVYGDYDVDGTTAVTLVYSFLKMYGAECMYYVPNRYTEGYGFSFNGVDYAAENGVSLIITLDCGIRDGEKIKYASEKGIDVIVCDHHEPAELPKAAAVLDPKRPDCTYPYKELSGCGVGFKLLQGFCIQNNINPESLYSYLDLVAISIGADIVSITGENRVLASHGLELLRKEKKRPGIQAMLDSAGFKKPQLDISDVVFIIAPRINAAGRLVSGTHAVELLLAQDEESAKKLSPAIEEMNSSRKEFDKSITTEAIELISSDEFYKDSFSTVIAGKDWHKGVVGIVASRLIEEYYKPTIVLVDDGERMAGSARSIEGIDLFEALGKCDELLEQFGGHTMAAGLSLKSENFEAFREKFDSIIRKHLNNEYPVPFIEYDSELNFDEITPKFYRILNQFAPFGPMNMKPVFLARNVVNAKFTRAVGPTLAHLKLHVKQDGNSNKAMDGIAFNMGKWTDYLQSGKAVDILFSVDENVFNGTSSLQLFIKDIRESEN